MRVDFYQLSRDPAELVVPLIARASKGAGEKLLVVAADAAQLAAIDRSLWETLPEAFLAHGYADAPHAERQPLLLSHDCEAANGAKFIALADGQWREEAQNFERVFLIFGDDRLADARQCWVMLGKLDGVERRFWKQDGGKWREGP
ncbi:DNA polymerase III subunit chi [Altererythrobacter endophyticus]|uniref:DNA polymerase III subunit chi n=2 Tax=Altericroceibacterium endophyticum TaxID=1808508 RepID=A0A6I4T9F1_9SPHN|nr:DNA polymerase III subunit chi [Altericroceibacterium endophyticum]MXO66781.1 DNA polymerase III subunit chi [Altericroceibacterium endophyticum]